MNPPRLSDESSQEAPVPRIDANGFSIRKCANTELAEILDVQNEAFSDMPRGGLLRINTKEMFLECLRAPNITLGAWFGDRLAAFSILYYPHDEAEDLSVSLNGVGVKGEKTANYKLCIVRREFRGKSLQYVLGLEKERIAIESGTKLLCATVSPDNPHSIDNILRLGFIYNRTLMKYGYERNLYYKFVG